MDKMLPSKLINVLLIKDVYHHPITNQLKNSIASRLIALKNTQILGALLNKEISSTVLKNVLLKSFVGYSAFPEKLEAILLTVLNALRDTIAQRFNQINNDSHKFRLLTNY